MSPGFAFILTVCTHHTITMSLEPFPDGRLRNQQRHAVGSLVPEEDLDQPEILVLRSGESTGILVLRTPSGNQWTPQDYRAW